MSLVQHLSSYSKIIKLIITKWIYIYDIVMTILLSRYNEVVIDYIHSPSMPPYRKVWKGTYIFATICVAPDIILFIYLVQSDA